MPTPVGACCGRRRSRLGRGWVPQVGWGGSLRSSGPGVRRGGQAQVRLPVIPSPRRGGMMGFAVLRSVGVNQNGRPRRVGVMTCTTRADRVRWLMPRSEACPAR
jgi:hypothetical protein